MRLLIGPVFLCAMATTALAIDYHDQAKARSSLSAGFDLEHYRSALPARIGFQSDDGADLKAVRTVAFLSSRIAGAVAVRIGEAKAKDQTGANSVVINRHDKVDFPEDEFRQQTARLEEDTYSKFKTDGKSDRVAIFAATFTAHFADFLVSSDYMRNSGGYKDCRKSSNILDRC